VYPLLIEDICHIIALEDASISIDEFTPCLTIARLHMISSEELSEYMIYEYFFYFFDTKHICPSFPRGIEIGESILVEHSCIICNDTGSCELVMSCMECLYWILYLIRLQ
jgi:hypothetical protein